MKHARADYNRIQDPAGLIPDDEPVFLIRGQDICGPAALDAWCMEARAQGASPDIIAKVEQLRADMIEWQDHDGNGRWKVPDLPAEDGER